MTRGQVTVGLSGLAVAALTAVLVTQVTASDPRLQLCPVGSGRVATSFALDHARDYRAAIPNWTGRTPELESSDRPAFFVVFAGPVSNLPVFGGPAQSSSGFVPGGGSKTYSGVVCVVIDDHPIVYADIDTSVIRRP